MHTLSVFTYSSMMYSLVHALMMCILMIRLSIQKKRKNLSCSAVGIYIIFSDILPEQWNDFLFS